MSVIKTSYNIEILFFAKLLFLSLLKSNQVIINQYNITLLVLN